VTLLHPWFLLLALLPLLALRPGRRRAVAFGPAALARGLPRSWRVRLRFLPGVLGFAGMLLAVFALARPIERVPLPRRGEGIDIVLCLDVSSSMTERDLDAARTRLDVAKETALAFIDSRPQDRIGLVSFARYPDLRCPPTLDHEALARVLGDVELVAGDGPEDATGIGTAIARAASALDGGVVILLTDGDENVATTRSPDEIAPVHAGQWARERGVRVYALTVGTGRRAVSGERVELDPRQLRRVAAQTGGRFFEARDAADLAAIYHEIDTLERVEYEEPRYETIERFLPFLAGAIALLVAGRILQLGALGVQP